MRNKMRLTMLGLAWLVSALVMATTMPVNVQAISVLVVEANDADTFRQNQLANKFVPTAGTSIAGTGQFTLTSLGPTALAALTCTQIQAFDVVYVPLTSAPRNAVKDNPAFAQCFASSERAVITGYHAEDHSQSATGQFLFDALIWIDGGSQVGLLVLNDVRSSPQKYDFLQPMFPGVFTSVRNQVVPYQNITFLTTPPHPVHADTTDGVQNLGAVGGTMDNWNQTCHTIWDTLGPGNGGYEDDAFIAVSEGSGFGQGPHVCAIAKEARCEDPDPRTQGFWRRVCEKNHPDQPDRSILMAELCEDLNPDPHSDPCERARSQFAALLYNIASDRVQEGCIDDNTGDDVGATVDAIDVLIAEGTKNSCKIASSLAASLNEGNVSEP